MALDFSVACRELCDGRPATIGVTAVRQAGNGDRKNNPKRRRKAGFKRFRYTTDVPYGTIFLERMRLGNGTALSGFAVKMKAILRVVCGIRMAAYMEFYN